MLSHHPSGPAFFVLWKCRHVLQGWLVGAVAELDPLGVSEWQVWSVVIVSPADHAAVRAWAEPVFQALHLVSELLFHRGAYPVLIRHRLLASGALVHVHPVGFVSTPQALKTLNQLRRAHGSTAHAASAKKKPRLQQITISTNSSPPVDAGDEARSR